MPADLIWDVVWKTAFVLVMLYGVLWAVRRLSGRTVTARRGPAISVVETAHLGPGRAVHLVGVGNKLLILGATSHQVSLLAEVSASDLEETPAQIRGSSLFERYLAQAKEVAATVSAHLKTKGEPAALKDSGRSEAGE